MMSSPKPAEDVKVDVKISKETGGAYADVRQVIESELARINQERANKEARNGSNRNTNDTRNGDSAQ